MRLIQSQQVHALVSMADAIEALRASYRDILSSPVLCPARIVLSPPGSNAYFGAMPAFGGRGGKYMVKVAALHLGADAHAPSTMHSLISLQDGVTGNFDALIEGNSITALRTGATSGLVTDLLAPATADTVAIIGSGKQALTQLEAMCAVRKIKTAHIYSRNRDNVLHFIHRCESNPAIDCALVAAPSLKSALEGAAIVCTATTSETPIIEALDLAQHCHINAVGNHTEHSIEIACSVLEQAFLVVEERAAAMREAGSFNQRAFEIGELLAAPAPTRTAQRSVFVSVGTAFQDLSIATLIYQKAVRAGTGERLQFA
jgi:ornithine cyclodeaminase/alanine dehydrogenase-like protein (mu-crystallin family)